MNHLPTFPPVARNASPITRRDHLRLLGGLGLLSIAPRSLFAEPATDRVRHLPLPIGSAPELALPEGSVTGFGRFGWRAFAVGAEPVVLKGFDGGASIAEGADCRLRLTNAVDVRDDHAFEVTMPDGQGIGTFVVRFAALFQVQEMRLTVEQARAVLQQGVVLKMVKGSRPVWFFAPSPEAKPVPDAAQRTLTGLTKHLTPDGLLAGAAQSNKGGDKLQEGGYRTIYQMGMGLHLQLMAAV